MLNWHPYIHTILRIKAKLIISVAFYLLYDVCVGMCAYVCVRCAHVHTQVTENNGNEGGVFAFSVMKLKIFLMWWYLIAIAHCCKSLEVLQLSLACVCPATLLHTTSTGKFQ